MNYTPLVLLVLLVVSVPACNEPKKTPEVVDFSERNKSSIKIANEELFNKANLDFADEVFTGDYAKGGPEIVKKYIEELRSAFPDVQVTIDPIIAENNMVAWQRTHTGTHEGAYLGFEPTGNRITWRTMIFSQYNEDGKVLKEWSISDLFEVLRKMEIEQTRED